MCNTNHQLIYSSMIYYDTVPEYERRVTWMLKHNERWCETRFQGTEAQRSRRRDCFSWPPLATFLLLARRWKAATSAGDYIGKRSMLHFCPTSYNYKLCVCYIYVMHVMYVMYVTHVMYVMYVCSYVRTYVCMYMCWENGDFNQLSLEVYMFISKGQRAADGPLKLQPGYYNMHRRPSRRFRVIMAL